MKKKASSRPSSTPCDDVLGPETREQKQENASNGGDFSSRILGGLRKQLSLCIDKIEVIRVGGWVEMEGNKPSNLVSSGN